MRLGILTTLLSCCYLTLTVGAQEPHHPEQEGPRRIERVLQAAEHLEQAGLHDEARAMRERAEMMQRELRAQHEHHGDHGELGPLPEIMHQLEALRDQVQQMRNELRETHQLVEALRNELRNRPHPSPFPPVLVPDGEPVPLDTFNNGRGEPRPRQPQILKPQIRKPTEPSTKDEFRLSEPDQREPQGETTAPIPLNSTENTGVKAPVQKVPAQPFATGPIKLINS